MSNTILVLINQVYILKILFTNVYYYYDEFQIGEYQIWELSFIIKINRLKSIWLILTFRLSVQYLFQLQT